ncbi:MAG: hypothetical protein GTN76_15975, partial [Candidatus Aenigmarchaeota archaeon]|nr:hypothetical protein [Candidatus Aenigmarchaeota archaeon]
QHGNTADHSSRLLFGAVILLPLAVLNLFGLILMFIIIFSLLNRHKVRRLLQIKFTRYIVGLLVSIFLFWVWYGLFVWKGGDLGSLSGFDLVRKTLKDSLSFPALHIVLYFEAFPVMTTLCCIGSLVWVLSDHGGNNGNGSEASIFFWFWIPLFALGFARPWIDLRYSLMIYPLYLAIFAWTIFRMICFGCEKVGDTSLLEGLLSNGHRLILGTGLSIFLVLFPALNEHHGIQDALKVGRLTYGQPISPLFHGFPFHPDHQGAGRYVRANLDENDIVIAMDIFEQYYYVGRIDYWLIK